MIALYTFGPFFGLPDSSPFVMKTMLLLKLAGLPYEEKRASPLSAPKRKLPYIEDDGVIVPDSTFIRFHIEKKYGIDFDAGLSPEQKAAAWSIEKMCEEHLYWGLVAARWADNANFAKGPAQFFNSLPFPLRPAIRALVRRKVLQASYLQGFGRHSLAEQERLAITDIDALAVLLGEKPYLMGERPCGADASVFSFVAQALAPTFETPIRAAAENHGSLIAYRGRVQQRYF